MRQLRIPGWLEYVLLIALIAGLSILILFVFGGEQLFLTPPQPVIPAL